MPVATAAAVREHLDGGVNDDGDDGASEDGNVFSKEEILQRLEKCALDNDIMRVLLDNSLTADDKCYRYHRCVENYLYKKDRKVKKIQYNFESYFDDDGVLRYVYKPTAQEHPVKKFLKKNTGAILGPVVGAILGNAYRLFVVGSYLPSLVV